MQTGPPWYGSAIPDPGAGRIRACMMGRTGRPMRPMRPNRMHGGCADARMRLMSSPWPHASASAQPSAVPISMAGLRGVRCGHVAGVADRRCLDMADDAARCVWRAGGARFGRAVARHSRRPRRYAGRASGVVRERACRRWRDRVCPTRSSSRPATAGPGTRNCHGPARDSAADGGSETLIEVGLPMTGADPATDPASPPPALGFVTPNRSAVTRSPASPAPSRCVARQAAPQAGLRQC